MINNYYVYTKLQVTPQATFHNMSHAKRYIREQQKIWVNAKFRIEWWDNGVKKVLSMEPNFMKLRKKDIRGNHKVMVNPKKFAPIETPNDDEFYGESEAEHYMRAQKIVHDGLSMYNVPFKTTDTLTWWEKIGWFFTKTERIQTEDGVLVLKRRKGKVFILAIE